MDNFNAVGRLTKDASQDTTPGGTAVVEFRMAIDSGFKKANADGEMVEHTDFVPVKLYGEVASKIGQWLTKGRLIQVTGRVNQNTWKTDDDQNRERFEIVANRVRLLDKAPQGAHDTSEAAETASSPS